MEWKNETQFYHTNTFILEVQNGHLSSQSSEKALNRSITLRAIAERGFGASFWRRARPSVGGAAMVPAHVETKRGSRPRWLEPHTSDAPSRTSVAVRFWLAWSSGQARRVWTVRDRRV